jgi:hypothetical protein
MIYGGARIPKLLELLLKASVLLSTLGTSWSGCIIVDRIQQWMQFADNEVGANSNDLADATSSSTEANRSVISCWTTRLLSIRLIVCTDSQHRRVDSISTNQSVAIAR